MDGLAEKRGWCWRGWSNIGITRNRGGWVRASLTATIAPQRQDVEDYFPNRVSLIGVFPGKVSMLAHGVPCAERQR